MISYNAFQAELREHSATGYHWNRITHNLESIARTAEDREWQVPDSYVEFLGTIGAGVYFGGNLVIYPFGAGDAPTVLSETQKIRALRINDKFVFGYDGTTSGCFCLPMSKIDDRVFWLEWVDGRTSLEAESFFEWIESRPSELFIPKVYAGYKQIKDMDAIAGVTNKRRAFEIELQVYDKYLARPPDKPNDLLPRYNRLTLRIIKTSNVDLDCFTIKCKRTGSPVGNDNVEYVTIDVKGIPAGAAVTREAYLFDPFNLPFESIEIEAGPYIDLSSKMRAKYGEIQSYL